MQNPDCLFCKIVAKQVPANVVYEDESSIAFLDITPRTTGHTVVIPKEHAPSVIELSEDKMGELFLAVKRVDELLLRTLTPDGVTIGINQGSASGQEIKHLHVHLMPRWHGDEGGAIQSVVRNTPRESVEEVRKKIVGS